jgi:hypothetical protein
MALPQAVALISTYTADNVQEQNQRRLVSTLEANKIDYILVDGADPDQKVPLLFLPSFLPYLHCLRILEMPYLVSRLREGSIHNCLFKMKMDNTLLLDSGKKLK